MIFIKITREFFLDETVKKIENRFLGNVLLILWVRILANGGMDMRLPLKKQAKIFKTDIFTLKRGIRLFQKLKLLDFSGNIIENRQVKKEKRRQYMRAYRQKIPEDKLSKEIKKIKRRVLFQDYPPILKGEMEEMIVIMAEVFLMKKSQVLYIDGVKTTAEFVSSVFLKLTHDHLLFAHEKYLGVNEEILKVKEYLRTVLYNSYFEMGPSYTNQAMSQM